MSPPRVLVLNGGSSAGKSSVARELQTLLDGVWLRLGVDTLIDAAPPSLLDRGGLVLSGDGAVEVGADFIAVEGFWMAGLARMAEAGARLLIEDGFVSGPPAQDRWRDALGPLPVGWVGIRCDPDVAAERERRRGDRVPGMAGAQALAVHEGIGYDLEVDTTSESPATVADTIHRHFFASRSPQ